MCSLTTHGQVLSLCVPLLCVGMLPLPHTPDLSPMNQPDEWRTQFEQALRNSPTERRRILANLAVIGLGIGFGCLVTLGGVGLGMVASTVLGEVFASVVTGIGVLLAAGCMVYGIRSADEFRIALTTDPTADN